MSKIQLGSVMIESRIAVVSNNEAVSYILRWKVRVTTSSLHTNNVWDRRLETGHQRRRENRDVDTLPIQWKK